MHFSITDYHTIKFQSRHGYLQRIYFFFRQLTIFIYFYFGFYSLSYLLVERIDMHFSITDYHTIKFQSRHGYLQRIYFFFRQLTIFIYFYFGFYSLSYQSITCHYRISFFLFETMINIPFLLRYFFAKKVLGIIIMYP